MLTLLNRGNAPFIKVIPRAMKQPSYLLHSSLGAIFKEKLSAIWGVKNANKLVHFL